MEVRGIAQHESSTLRYFLPYSSTVKYCTVLPYKKLEYWRNSFCSVGKEAETQTVQLSPSLVSSGAKKRLQVSVTDSTKYLKLLLACLPPTGSLAYCCLHLGKNKRNLQKCQTDSTPSSQRDSSSATFFFSFLGMSIIASVGEEVTLI